jgi:hypothetical protein
MYIRRPAVAGSFYPSNSRELEKLVNDFLKNVKTDKKACVAAVAPHAGYIYCGNVFASVYASLEKNFESVVIVGPNHYGKGGITTCKGIWQTPLGNLRTDDEFIDEVAKNCEKITLIDDKVANSHEHSIEVQLPWLQSLFTNFGIVPLSINPVYFDVEECKDLANAIFRARENLGKKILVIASSDFTHYGEFYNYVPFRGSISEILEKIKRKDMEMVKAVKDFAIERIIELGSESTICGFGCIAIATYFAKLAGAKSCEPVAYSTSFDISKSLEAIVAYCGLILY